MKPLADRRSGSDAPRLPEGGALPVRGLPKPQRRRRARPRPPHPMSRPPVPYVLRPRAGGWSNSSVPRARGPEKDAARRAVPDRRGDRIRPCRARYGGEAPPPHARAYRALDLHPPSRQRLPPQFRPAPGRASRRPPSLPEPIRSRPLPDRPGSRSGTGEKADHGSNAAPEVVRNRETILPASRDTAAGFLPEQARRGELDGQRLTGAERTARGGPELQ